MLKAIRNTVANFIGSLTALVATLVFNALYFRMVPDEVFGIISLLLTATLLAPAVDFGTGRTAGRILARDLAAGRGSNDLCEALATLQVTNLAIGSLLGGALMWFAPAIATGWLAPERLSVSEVAQAVLLIGACFALMVPRYFVTVCFNGMKRQVLANFFLIVFTLLRGIVGLVVLAIDGSLTAFLTLQLLVQAIDTGLGVIVLWWLMPRTSRFPRLTSHVLRTSWRFALGDGLASLIGACLVQGDKVLLSTLLPLSSYGAYALVSTIANGVGRFASPFAAAFLPHYVELIALAREDELRHDYLVSTQLLSCVILPIAAVTIAFAPEIVAALIGETDQLGPLPLAFALLVAATIIGNLLHLPHAIQLAAGDSVTALRFTIVNSALYIALIVILTPRIAVLGPAVSLLAIYAVTFGLFARVTSRMIDVRLTRWVRHSILGPGMAAAVIALLARVVTPGGLGLFAGVAWLAVVTLAALGAALAVSPGARNLLGAYVSRLVVGRNEAEICGRK